MTDSEDSTYIVAKDDFRTAPFRIPFGGQSTTHSIFIVARESSAGLAMNSDLNMGPEHGPELSNSDIGSIIVAVSPALSFGVIRASALVRQ